MPNYRILRQFSGDRLFRIGEVVALDGRNIKGLVENRFVEPTEDAVTAPVEAQAAPQATPPKRGRGRPRKTPVAALAASENPTAA